MRTKLIRRSDRLYRATVMHAFAEARIDDAITDEKKKAKEEHRRPIWTSKYFQQLRNDLQYWKGEVFRHQLGLKLGY